MPNLTFAEETNQTANKVANIFRDMAQNPEILKAYKAANGSLVQGSLDAQDRELIALAVAQRNNCDYCLAAHTEAAKKAGLTNEQALAIRRGDVSLPAKRALTDFVNAVLERKGVVTDDELARVRAAGYTQAQITEILFAVALNTFTNFFNNVNRTELDFPKAPNL